MSKRLDRKHCERPANSLLAALPRQAYSALLPRLTPVSLVFGDVLYEPGATIPDVYFPGRSMVSLLTVVDGHAALEVGLVGHEGMVGIPLALGVAVSPVRALVQGAGGALQMSAARYTHSLMTQITQTAACNRFHRVDARLARWLLMTRDRACSARFHLTHEFLGHMLGVRRVGVTEAASALHERGLIDYSRGNIRILDNAGLKAASCSCYAPLGMPPPR
jgi:CRP-like cAMP-binding protein